MIGNSASFASNVNELSFWFVYFTLVTVYKFLWVYIPNPNQDNIIKALALSFCIKVLQSFHCKVTMFLPNKHLITRPRHRGLGGKYSLKKKKKKKHLITNLL